MVIFDQIFPAPAGQLGVQDSPPDEAHGQQHPGLFEAPRCWCLGAVGKDQLLDCQGTVCMHPEKNLTVYYLYLILIY